MTAHALGIAHEIESMRARRLSRWIPGIASLVEQAGHVDEIRQAGPESCCSDDDVKVFGLSIVVEHAGRSEAIHAGAQLYIAFLQLLDPTHIDDGDLARTEGLPGGRAYAVGVNRQLSADNTCRKITT